MFDAFESVRRHCFMFVVVNGQKIKMEQRRCANKRCNNLFWTVPQSKQTICSRECYFLGSDEKYRRIKMPKPVRVSPKEAKKIIESKPKDPKFVKIRNNR